MNNELGQIQSLLASGGTLLKPGGRLVLISFHSLEDRLVKDAFKAAKDARIFEVLTKKPVIAADEESRRNPRARSAKMRAAEKLPQDRSYKAKGANNTPNRLMSR